MNEKLSESLTKYNTILEIASGITNMFRNDSNIKSQDIIIVSISNDLLITVIYIVQFCNGRLDSVTNLLNTILSNTNRLLKSKKRINYIDIFHDLLVKV